MTAEALDLLQCVLRLPAEARAFIADSLYESLEERPADPRIEALWAREIERRVADLDAGRAKTVPWSEVNRRVEAILTRA